MYEEIFSVKFRLFIARWFAFFPAVCAQGKAAHAWTRVDQAHSVQECLGQPSSILSPAMRVHIILLPAVDPACRLSVQHTVPSFLTR